MQMTHPVLYIHPASQMMFREIIPLSLPAVVHRIPAPVLGRFPDEVTPEEVRGARVIFMDIHWYLTLPGALALAARLKALNPRVQLIAGGMTASIFSGQLVNHTAIDFVIRGDGEVPLPALIETLLDGGDPQAIPNVRHREFSTPWSFHLTSELMDELEYNHFGFFPSFERGLVDLHSRPGARPFSTHPFCVPFRGCPLPCEHCIGAPGYQCRLFRRGAVRRSASRLRDDLTQLSEDPRWRYVNFFHDFIGLSPAPDVARVLDSPYDLTVYYEFARLPPADALERLLDAFRGGIMQFCVDRFHVTSTDLCDPEALIARIRMAQRSRRYQVRLAYSKVLASQHPRYLQTVKEITRATGCVPWDGSVFWSDFPQADENGDGSDEAFARYAANRGRRFTFLNFAIKCGLAVQRVFPRTVNYLGDLLIGRNLYT